MEEVLRHATFSVVTVSLAHNNSSVVFFSTSVDKIYNLESNEKKYENSKSLLSTPDRSA